MTKFFDKWVFVINVGFLLVLAGAGGAFFGWPGTHVLLLLVAANVWAAAGEVRNQVVRRFDQKISVNSLSDSSVQSLKAAQEFKITQGVGRE